MAKTQNPAPVEAPEHLENNAVENGDNQEPSLDEIER